MITHKISETSRLFLSEHKANLTLRAPANNMAFAFLFMAFGFMGFIFSVISLFKSVNQGLIGTLLVSLIGILWPVYLYGKREEVEINVKQKMLVLEKRLYHHLLKSVTFNWTDNMYFKYEITRDSYNNIAKIWLVASRIDKKQNTRLVEFDPDSFFNFQKLFNRKFPEHFIKEWHD